MFDSILRSSLCTRRGQSLFLIGGVCLLHGLVACGSATGEDDGSGGQSGSVGLAGASTSATAGAASVGSAGAPSGGGAPSTGGSANSAGGPSGGGASGAATTSAGAGGKSGTAGSSGTTSTAGGTGTGAGGAAATGTCSTPPAADTVIGWAAQSGMGVTTTTGGGSAKPVTVTSVGALTSAVAGTSAAVIYVSGKLAAGKIKVGSNKTIVGLCNAEIHGYLGLNGSSNVIVRNLKIVGYGVGNCALDPDFDSSVGCSSGNDAVTINDQSHHIWVDHCDISDGTDGNLDTTQGSDFVTISWTKFHYTTRTDNSGNDSTGAEGHRFSNLIGAADNVSGDTGHLNITWHHDWWADNVVERMPRSRAGKIHMFDNLFTAKGNSYCSNAGQGAALLIENSVYSGVKDPFQVLTGAVGLVSKGNTFPGSSGTETGSGSAFTPPYAYTLEAASAVQADIQANAGPH